MTLTHTYAVERTKDSTIIQMSIFENGTEINRLRFTTLYNNYDSAYAALNRAEWAYNLRQTSLEEFYDSFMRIIHSDS